MVSTKLNSFYRENTASLSFGTREKPVDYSVYDPGTTAKLIHGVNSNPSPSTPGVACISFFFFKGSFVVLLIVVTILFHSLKQGQQASVPGLLGPLSGVSDCESVEHKALYTKEYACLGTASCSSQMVQSLSLLPLCQLITGDV